MKRILPPRKRTAFTLVGLLVILAVLAILAAMLLPALAKAKARAQSVRCMNNLKQVGIAFRIWESDHEDKFPMSVSITNGGSREWGGNASRHFQALSNELNTPKILVCPSDTRPAAADFISLRSQNLSYFVSLDAEDTRPQLFLSGDRNITNEPVPPDSILLITPDRPPGWTDELHRNFGNIALADGSVQGYSTAGLRKASAGTTNHLALP